MPSELTDDELMKKIGAGEASAFEQLVDRYGDVILGYCLRTLGGNRAMAEDIGQEVWFKVIRQAHRYEPQGHFKAWLMTVTRNETVSQIRRNSRLVLDGFESENEPVSEVDLETELLRRYQESELRTALEKLPEVERITLLIHLTEDLPQEEIARALGTTTQAVRSTLYRARKNLKEILERK